MLKKKRGVAHSTTIPSANNALLLALNRLSTLLSTYKSFAYVPYQYMADGYRKYILAPFTSIYPIHKLC